MPAPKINPFNEELPTEQAAEAEELAPIVPENAAEAAPAEAEQPAAEAAPAEAQPEAPSKTIPYERFQEINERRKAAEKTAAELQEKWARLDERSKQLREAQQAAQQQAEAQQRAAERPDPTVDPVGAELWDTKQAMAQMQSQFQQLQGQFAQQVTGLQQNQQQAEFNNWVDREAANYATQDPAYYDKARYAASKRMEFWQSLGATPEMSQELVARESFALAAMARSNGKHFPTIVSGLATGWGWQPQQPTQNGNTATPASSPAPAPTAAQQRLNQVQKGQTVQGLSRVPGAGTEAATTYRNYTPAQIASMTEAEFNAAMSDPKAKKDLMFAISQSEGVDPADMRL